MTRRAAKRMGPESVQTGPQMWGITCTGRFRLLGPDTAPGSRENEAAGLADAYLAASFIKVVVSVWRR